MSSLCQILVASPFRLLLAAMAISGLLSLMATRLGASPPTGNTSRSLPSSNLRVPPLALLQDLMAISGLPNLMATRLGASQAEDEYISLSRQRSKRENTMPTYRHSKAFGHRSKGEAA